MNEDVIIIIIIIVTRFVITILAKNS